MYYLLFIFNKKIHASECNAFDTFHLQTFEQQPWENLKYGY